LLAEVGVQRVAGDILLEVVGLAALQPLVDFERLQTHYYKKARFMLKNSIFWAKRRYFIYKLL
jgi:hypothetical protein